LFQHTFFYYGTKGNVKERLRGTKRRKDRFALGLPAQQQLALACLLVASFITFPTRLSDLTTIYKSNQVILLVLYVNCASTICHLSLYFVWNFLGEDSKEVFWVA